MTDRIEKDELRDAHGAAGPTGAEREARARRRRYERPQVDIYSTDTQIVVIADMPGVRKSDLDVALDRDELAIEGTAAGRKEKESALPWGYYRRFKLKTAFNRDGINASLEGGILTVTLPKADSEQVRKISID